MDPPEALARIYTSSWMRRVWTLQGGALAQSLYFQFADEALSMNQVARVVMRMTGSMRHRAAFNTSELQGLRMQKVWQLISTKHGGIPSQIIFFEDPTLAAKG